MAMLIAYGNCKFCSAIIADQFEAGSKRSQGELALVWQTSTTSSVICSPSRATRWRRGRRSPPEPPRTMGLIPTAQKSCRLTLSQQHVRNTPATKRSCVPGWRNWQTRRTQNPVLAREWEFDPPSGHHQDRPREYFMMWRHDLAEGVACGPRDQPRNIKYPLDSGALLA